MKNLKTLIALALVGLIAGVVIGEFFPRLFSSGLMSSIGNAVSDPFTRYRNDLAAKYGLFGAGIGAAAGLITMLMGKR